MSGGRSIAIVVPRYSAEGTIGGAETLLKALGHRLAARGTEVTFLTTCARNHFTWANEWSEGASTDGPVQVRRFAVDGGRDGARHLALQERMGRAGALTRAEEEEWMRHSVHSAGLYAHLRAEGARYDRILAGPYLFGVVLEAAGIHPDRTWLVPCLHDEPAAHTTLVRERLAAVRGCLFNSEPEQALAARLAPGVRGAVVGMGLEPFDADPHAFAARRGLTGPYVVYGGRREPLKGTPLLVEYVGVFRERMGVDLTLVLTGSGDYPVRPYVLDAGVLDETEKREAFAGARVFIHPSRLESFGIVLLEAFAAGTPGLVHAGGDVLRWQCARSGAGWWFRHYPDFEALLQRLLTNEPLRAAMGARGRAFTRGVYAWPAVEARLEAALGWA
jgi:glycosyltransferase involved in cell wall biosynthesis